MSMPPAIHRVSATFSIAPNASPGPRNVTVTTDSGTSGPVQFTLNVPTIPAPTLTSITPPAKLRGTTATLTLTGTNFVTGATSVAADGSGISITNVTVTSPTSLTATLSVAGDANVGDHNVRVSTAGGGSNALTLNIQAQGLAFVYAMPQMLNPTDNTPIQVALANASPDAVTGTLTLTFNPNASIPSDDPNVTFINAQTSTRTATVTFPPNTATADLSLPNGVLQAGTVAGTIQLAISDVQMGGMDVAPADTGFDVQIPRLPPVITSVRIINRTSKGFDVEITGYSTSREIGTATFDFGAASGEKLLTAELQPDVTSSFVTYYQSPSSDPAGGAFVYTQPFVIKQGTVKAVASVTVTLANSQGSSPIGYRPIAGICGRLDYDFLIIGPAQHRILWSTGGCRKDMARDSNTTDVTQSDYRALAEFRYQIGRYLAFGDQAAESAGLRSRQYQLLLALKGMPDGMEASIKNLADRLGIRHHSTVELVDRLEKARPH